MLKVFTNKLMHMCELTGNRNHAKIPCMFAYRPKLEKRMTRERLWPKNLFRKCMTTTPYGVTVTTSQSLQFDCALLRAKKVSDPLVD